MKSLAQDALSPDLEEIRKPKLWLESLPYVNRGGVTTANSLGLCFIFLRDSSQR
jgi:hypothetical protein